MEPSRDFHGLVSVIITTFNREHFLADALDSVLKQDYPAKEIIVIDDGSEESSYKLLRELPVRYAWQPNAGISAARNRGIGLARGELITFLDVDDIWARKKLSSQVAAMKKGGYSVCYTDETWIRNGRHLNQKKRHAKFSGDIFEKCLPLCIISPSSVMIKREVFDEVGLFDESLPVCEDYDMWLRVTARYPVFFLKKKLIIKQGGHEDQLSKRFEAMDRFRIESMVKILKSGVLSGTRRMATEKELARKCEIYRTGAEKRGNTGDVLYCNDIFSWLVKKE